MDLTAKPWNGATVTPPEGVFSVKGMLGDEERRCLYWLARYLYSGAGAIIDAGSFIGASAYCLAEGLRANPNSAGRTGVIHAYDLFEAWDQYVADAITRDIRPLALGDKYQDIFEQQNRDHLDLIAIHSGDLCRHQWTSGPIEILFIDVAKTLKLNSHLVQQFFPALIPGRSIVVQQDFYHIWHPYIHVTMEYLRDYFEIVDGLVVHQSRVYRLREAIPKAELERVVSYGFTARERTALLLRSAQASSSPVREMLEAITLLDAIMAEDRPLFLERWSAFQQENPGFASRTELWAYEIPRVLDDAVRRGWVAKLPARI